MSRPPWMIDELAHAGHEHLDPAYVPAYDAKAQTDPQQDLGPITGLGFGPGHTLLDLGAGTGTFALAAAGVFERVIAADVSPQMLGILQAAIAERDVTNITPLQAGFLTYEHQEPPLDVVYSRHALHHLPDFWKVIALNRIAGWLRPGGILYLRDLVYDVDPAQAESMIDTWTSRGAPSSDVGWTAGELQEHVREEHSTFGWLLTAMLERCGFTIRESHVSGSIYAVFICERP